MPAVIRSLAAKMIIDTHQHLGESMFSGVATSADQLVEAMDHNGVGFALVMPQPTLEPIQPVHDDIAASVDRFPDRFAGMASINPWWSETDYVREAQRCLNELRFVALKLHPLGHNIAPNHPECNKVFQTAREHQVPVIVHTGLGTPWSLPSLCIPPAMKYPDVHLILAHAGWGVYAAEAFVVAEICPNVILEPSWCPSYAVKQMVDTFGAERLIYGSDHISNMPVELARYRAIGLPEQQRKLILEENPLGIFSRLRDGPC